MGYFIESALYVKFLGLSGHVKELPFQSAKSHFTKICKYEPR